jgi:hypothetical protein
MLRFQAIAMACLLLFFFSGAVYTLVKLTERESKKSK